MVKRVLINKSLLLTTLLIVFSCFIGLGISAFSRSKDIIKTLASENQTLDYYTSSRYTKVDDLTINPFKGAEIIEVVDEAGNYDQLIHENARLAMYFNERLNIIKLKNKVTNYVWTSALDKIATTDVPSPYHASFLASTVGIGYYFYNTTNDSYGDTQYSFINQARLVKDATHYILEPNTTEVEVKSTITSSGVMLDVNAKKYQITLKVVIDLEDNGLVVKVPDQEITENIHLLSRLHLFPAFGATRGTDEPGYMVIPDGSGALIRYGEVSQTSQIALRYYGDDLGIGSTIKDSNLNPEKKLLAPIYGLINGVNQHGLLTIIEDGSESAELFISLKGTLNINYNFLTPRFIMRNKYLLYGVNSTVERERSSSDLAVNYVLLEAEDANYVGLANVYHDYLVNQNELFKTSEGKYQVLLDVIMSETVPALIGTKNITLTSLNQLQDLLSQLQAQEVKDITLILKGWNNKGLSGATPYQIKFNQKLGSKHAFKTFLKEFEGSVYLYNDYQISYSRGIASSRSDVARTIQRLKMNYTDTEAALYASYSLLYPQASLELAQKDIKKYQRLNAQSLAIDSIGSTLYSTYYNGHIASRKVNRNIYDKMMDELAKRFHIGLYQPNSYLWRHLSDYFAMSMFTNHYSLYTDTVPLIPYIIKGYIDYYATSVNFYANLSDQVLRLLDYGAYPSFTITNSPARDLKYTNSNQLFSTRFSDWERVIVSIYQKYAPVYNLISDARVVRRSVISSGIVEIAYNNGIELRINYTEQPYLTTPANDFEIIKGVEK